MKLYALLLSFFVSTCCLFAQDIHYTQFYADPIRLNPAQTGNFTGDYRIGLNARTQWKSVTVPYQTISTYLDFSLLKGKGLNWLGVGINALYDRAGNGELATTEIRGSLAAHQAFTENFYLSVGTGLTYVNKLIDFEQLQFSNQWNDVNFSPAINSGEAYISQSFQYIDASVGATANVYVHNALSFQGGISLAHFNRPAVTFFDEEDSRLGIRNISFLESKIGLNDWSIEPGVYFTQQKRAREWAIGSNVGYTLQTATKYQKSSHLYVGIWYRLKDALSGLIGYQWNNYRFLANYDVNLSALTPASQGRGAFEISLVRVGFLPNANRFNNKTVHCPRF